MKETFFAAEVKVELIFSNSVFIEELTYAWVVRR